MSDENKKVTDKIASKQLGDVFKKKEKPVSRSYGTGYGGYGSYYDDDYYGSSYGRRSRGSYGRRSSYRNMDRTPRKYTYPDLDEGSYDPHTGEVYDDFVDDRTDDLFSVGGTDMGSGSRYIPVNERGGANDGKVQDGNYLSQHTEKEGPFAKVEYSDWLITQDKIVVGLLDVLEREGLVIKDNHTSTRMARQLRALLSADQFKYRENRINYALEVVGDGVLGTGVK